MNCPDCFKEARSRNDLMQQALADAKTYAVQNQVNVVIYEEGLNNFKYIQQEVAQTAGIIPLQLVSFLQRVAP